MKYQILYKPFVAMVLIGVLSRVLPHPANFTAVGGLAVFGGSRLPLPKALALTFATMVISDLLIGGHSVMWATYVGMAGAVLLGHILAYQKHVGYGLAAALVSSVWFFLVTNFAVWTQWPGMYSHDSAGLVACYIAAIPFFRNSIVSDVLYTGMFVSVFDYVTRSVNARFGVIHRAA